MFGSMLDRNFLLHMHKGTDILVNTTGYTIKAVADGSVGQVLRVKPDLTSCEDLAMALHVATYN